MKYLWAALGIVAMVAIIFVIGFDIGYKISGASQARADAKALKSETDRYNKAVEADTTLATDNATLLARVNDLNQSIADQPAKERIVYVPIKPTAQNPTPAPEALTGPVFVTLGAVRLFNNAFDGLPESAGAPGGDTGGSDISSVTISQYESTTNSNASACYLNQQTVHELWRYIHTQQAAGFIAQ